MKLYLEIFRLFERIVTPFLNDCMIEVSVISRKIKNAPYILKHSAISIVEVNLELSRNFHDTLNYCIPKFPPNIHSRTVSSKITTISKYFSS